MKITGSMGYIKFDFENGYMMKAEGEILVGRKFIVYKDTMKTWEAPHETEEVKEEHIEKITEEVEKNTNKNMVQIIFE